MLKISIIDGHIQRWVIVEGRAVGAWTTELGMLCEKRNTDLPRLALTGDLHMDCVLDALLRSLAELVPHTCARVLVPEVGPHWLAPRERSCPEPIKKFPPLPLTFVARDSTIVMELRQ